jgi:hypothetical protein
MSNLTSPDENRPSIKTPQELVHIKHKITLLQYKYWVLMLRAYRETYAEHGRKLTDEEFCYITMSKLSEHLGYEPKTSDIERDLETIRKEPIIFNVLEKDGQKGREGKGFISEWYVSSNRIGVVFPPVLRRAVENLDNRESIFHLLNWSIFNSFTGKYEAVLYKLCKDYIGATRTPYFSLEKFRSYMGIKETEYQDFKRLNQWVISGPLKRINESELADVTIKAEFKREVRKVVGLWFEVASKKQTVMDFGDDPAFRFAKVSVSLVDQKKYLESNATENIELSIQRANEYAEEQEKQGKTVNFGALYRKAIVGDWGKEYHSKKTRETEKIEAQKKKQKFEIEEDRAERLNELKDEYLRVCTSTAIKALTVEQRHAHAMAWLQTEKGRGLDHDYDPKTANFRLITNKANFSQVYLRQVIGIPFDPSGFAAWLQSEKGVDSKRIGETLLLMAT